MKLRDMRLSALVLMVLAIAGSLLSITKICFASDKPAATTAKAPIDYQAEGERLFVAHCSRCHMAPTSISPRITGTVLNHMRVRAKLSNRDEQILLKFMAP